MSLDTQDSFGDFGAEPGSAVSHPGSEADVQAARWQSEHIAGGGYGAKTGPNAAAIAITVAVHAAGLAALLQLGSSYIAQKAERLVSVDLRSPPPPPEQAESVPPPPRQEIAVAEPPIKLSPPVPVAVMIDPQPIQAPAIPVPSLPQPVPVPAPPAPSAVPGIVDASDLGTRMLSGQPPRYPIESRRKREQGTVMLSVILGTDGRVADISVMESSGFPRLDRAAMKAVQHWRWEPTLRGGRPVMVRGIVPIPFILQGGA